MKNKNKYKNNDEYYVLLFKKGNIPAFNALMKKYHPVILKYCYYLSHNKSIAEELTQDTFINVYSGIQGLQQNHNFKAWVYSIAFHRFLDFKKAKKNREHLPIDNVPEGSIAPRDVELSNLVKAALQKLSNQERSALLLVDIAEHSYEEASSIMQVSLNEFKYLVRKSRQCLINYLKEYQLEVTGIVSLDDLMKKNVA